MESVVVGLQDQIALAAVEWVAERARSKPVQIRLVTAGEGSDPDASKDLLASAAERFQETVPETPIEFELVDGPMLHELLVLSESADLLVIGSHPDAGIRQSRTPSFPVSLAARSRCPVVIVPDDWRGSSETRVHDEQPRGSIVVGIDAESTSDKVAMFAATEAEAADRDLEVVHTWEPWNAPKARSVQIEQEDILDAAVSRVRAQYPSLTVRGILVEAVAHDGVLASSRGAHLVVLGTHGLGKATGVVLGAIHQELMIRGGVPLCVVPIDDAVR